MAAKRRTDNRMASGDPGAGLTGNPYILMSILLMLWGSFTAVSKFTLRSLDNFQVQFYMFGTAAVIMTIMLAVNGRINALMRMSIGQWGKLALYGIPSYLYYLFYILALQLIPAVEASMLNYMFPILIVLLSVPMNGEKLNAAIVTAMIFGIVGMLLIVTGGEFSTVKLTNLTGDLLALGGALCWALFSNFGKKNQVEGDLSNYVYTLVALVLSGVGLLVFSEFAVPDFVGGSGVVWLAVSNIVFAYYLWFKGLKSPSFSLIANLSFLTPFFTLLFIVVLLGESVKPFQLYGFIFILLGTFIQAVWGHSGRKKSRTASDRPASREELFK